MTSRAAWIRSARWLAAALTLFVTGLPETAAQCAMCGSAMGSRGGFARGFTISVLFMLSILALMVGGFIALVRARNRALETGPLRSEASSGPGRYAVPLWRACLRRIRRAGRPAIRAGS